MEFVRSALHSISPYAFSSMKIVKEETVVFLPPGKTWPTLNFWRTSLRNFDYCLAGVTDKKK
jgi:hypothetical protein